MRGIKKVKDKKKYDFETKMLILILLLAENGLYLIDFDSISIGPIKYGDIILFLYLTFGGYVLKKYKNSKTPRYKFKFVCLFTIVLVLISSIRSWSLVGQSISQGVSPQRQFLISYLMYFIMAKYFTADKKNFCKFERAVYIVGSCELFLYTVQYLLADVKIFLYVLPTNRFGEVRLMFISNLLCVFTFMVFSNLLRGKNTKKNAFLFIANIMYFLVVSKTRILVLGMGLSVIILCIMWRKNLLVKGAFIFIALGLSIILLRMPLLNNYVTLLNSEVRHSDGNYLIRLEGKNFYKEEISKSPIVGRGFPNEKNLKAVEACRVSEGYFLIDNGVTGFTYIYGFIGVLWLIWLFIEIGIASLKVYRKKNDYSMFGYLIFCISILSNVMQVYWGTGSFYTGIVMGLLEDRPDDDNT